MKYILLLIALICIPISCTNEDNYSQLQEWRTELRVEIVEARRNINSTSDLTLRSDIYVNEVIGFYVWLKNNLTIRDFNRYKKISKLYINNTNNSRIELHIQKL